MPRVVGRPLTRTAVGVSRAGAGHLTPGAAPLGVRHVRRGPARVADVALGANFLQPDARVRGEGSRQVPRGVQVRARASDPKVAVRETSLGRFDAREPALESVHRAQNHRVVSRRGARGATSPSNAAATSPSGRRWSAPLPPPSPGTPSVFGRDARGSPSADVRTLGGNPLTAVNVAAHLGVGVLPSAAGRGYSGAVFGNLLRREEAASVVKFREMAVMRERIRADAVRGAGANDDAARAEIARLQKQVHALVADIDRFRGEEKMAEVVVDADRREDRGETPRRVGDENAEPADASRRAPEANLRAIVPHASSARSLLRDVLSDAAAKASEYYPSDAEFLSDASRRSSRDASDRSAAPSRPASRPNSRVAFSSPARSERSDRSGRYLRTTRRDTEEARYRRGLSPHSGGAPREFWGEGRGAVQGGANEDGVEGGGAEGADDGGAEGDASGAEGGGAEGGGTRGVLGATLASSAPPPSRRPLETRRTWRARRRRWRRRRRRSHATATSTEDTRPLHRWSANARRRRLVVCARRTDTCVANSASRNGS